MPDLHSADTFADHTIHTPSITPTLEYRRGTRVYSPPIRIKLAKQPHSLGDTYSLIALVFSTLTLILVLFMLIFVLKVI